MITSIEDTNKIWAQLNEELCSFPIEGIDDGADNLFIYMKGASKKWVIICAGTVKIASSPAINGEFALRPEYLVNHTLNYLRPTYDTIDYWEIEPKDRFMSIDNASIELMGEHFSFLLQIDKLGISMMDEWFFRPFIPLKETEDELGRVLCVCVNVCQWIPFSRATV